MNVLRAFRQMLCRTDELAEFGALDHRTHRTEPQPDGSTRHVLEGRMIETPPEYAEVYRRRGLTVPYSCSMFDPASLWPYLPRAPHERYANREGYFWAACPLCGTYYGGHEITGSTRLGHEQPGVSTSICPVCTAERNGGRA